MWVDSRVDSRAEAESAIKSALLETLPEACFKAWRALFEAKFEALDVLFCVLIRQSLSKVKSVDSMVVRDLARLGFLVALVFLVALALCALLDALEISESKKLDSALCESISLESRRCIGGVWCICGVILAQIDSR